MCSDTNEVAFRDLGNHDIKIAGESDRERYSRERDQEAAGVMHFFVVFASINEAVIGGRRHQQHHGQRDKPNAERRGRYARCPATFQKPGSGGSPQIKALQPSGLGFERRSYFTG